MVEALGDGTLSDEDLLARIANEDRRAFTILMRRHGQKVRGLALAFGGKAADADDVTQDIFIMLWAPPEFMAARKGGVHDVALSRGRQSLSGPGPAAARAPLAPIRGRRRSGR